MKIIFEMDWEEKLSNIGIAKALTEVSNLNDSDLCEIGRHLLVYSDARAIENIAAPHMGCAEQHEPPKAVTV